MGKIVFYTSGPFNDDHASGTSFPGSKAVERQEGMQAAGKKLQAELQANGNRFRKAFLDTLRHLINNEPGIEVRYEFQNASSQFRSFRITTRGGRPYFFDLKKAANGNDRGHLVLDIERDEKFQDVHVMNVTAPRRSDAATAFDYLADVAGDIEHIRTGMAGPPNNQNKIEDYLKGTISFQRCD